MRNHEAREKHFSLVGTQKGIWFGQQVSSKPSEFNVAHFTEIDGDVDLDKFSKAVDKGIATADTLHSRYFEENGELKQSFPVNVSVNRVLEIFDFSEKPQAYDFSVEWMKKDLDTEIELHENIPRYRHCLIFVGKPDKPKWLWYQRYHHIDIDGFSFNGLTQYIVSEYNSLTENGSKASSFTPFTEVVAEHEAFVTSPQFIKSKEFWSEYTQELPEVTSLTTTTENSNVTGVVKHQVELMGGEWLRLYGNKILPSEVAMATMFAYLYLTHHQSSICVGFPFMRRLGSVASGSLGAVVNVLPLTVDLDPSMNIADIARVMNKSIRKVRRHQMYDAEQVQRDLGRVGQPLFGPMLNFKPFEETFSLDGSMCKTHILAAGPIDDIEFSPSLTDEGFALSLTANATKYTSRSLDILASRYAHIVQQIAQNPEITLKDMALMPVAELDQIQSWSTGHIMASAESHTSVIDVFEHNAKIKPDAMALSFKDTSWTFSQLQAAVNQRSIQMQHLGITKGDIVGVALPRSAETIISLLAILRSGAVYLPIDLDYPQERIETILAQATPKMVIVDSVDNVTWAEKAPCIRLSDLKVSANQNNTSFPETISADDVAYIVFTSGSTGQPKGVMNTHSALLNLLHSHQTTVFSKAIRQLAMIGDVDINEIQVRAAHTTSFAFDASWEQVIWLLCGHSLYLYDDEQRKDAYELCQLVESDQIDALDLPPSLFSQMLDNGLMENQNHVPTLVLIGSEAVPENLWSRARSYPHLLVENFYGPTEFTVDAVSASLSADTTPVIGRPILNAKAYVLDNQLNWAATGQVGELYLAGAGLAKGYLNQAGMTGERFIADPFSNGQVMYRTGDLVKWRENGQLDFIGRSDDQVKVRGFRIELGDVESAINSIQGVEATVVLVDKQAGVNRLVGYCTLASDADENLTEQVVLAKLAETVPEYMVPSALKIMDAFALNVNGKIDRKALPKISINAAKADWVAPTTIEEKVLCKAASELLSIDKVSVTDDFFNLGGDSISAMGLGTLLRKSGFDLRPKDIFSARTIGAMAQVIKPLQQRTTEDKNGALPALPMWNWFTETFGFSTSYVQGVFVEIEGDVSLRHLSQALTKLVSHNSALRLRCLDGDYAIVPDHEMNLNEWLCDTQVPDLKLAALDDMFENYSSKLSLEKERLFQLVRVKDVNGQQGLMILAHHVLIDGVSWRALLPQLQALTRSEVTGTNADIATEVTGLKSWSNALNRHLEQVSEQAGYWLEQEKIPQQSLKADSKQGYPVHHRFVLSNRITAEVLEQGQKSQAIDVDEILIAAATAALSEKFDRDLIKLNLESHGREEFDSSINLAQTLGWFTTEFPMVVDVSAKKDAQKLLREVKQSKRRVKDLGLGYMCLRHLENPYKSELTELASRNKAPLLFNYLGRFESGTGNWSPVTREGKFADTFAVSLNSEKTLLHDLELNVFVDESEGRPRFALNFTWDSTQFDHQEIEGLCRHIEDELCVITTWLVGCQDQVESLKVPAEYTQSQISLADAEALVQQYGSISDILPALPLQEGLLFQSQLGDANSNYNSTTRLSFHGQIDSHRVSQALNAVIHRHPQLQANFDSAVLGSSVQLIPQNLNAWPMEVFDVRQQSVEEQNAFIEQVAHNELVKQFDISGPNQALLGASLIYHGDNQSTVFISAHHLVVDGWSTPILLSDFLTAYEQNLPKLPSVTTRYAQVVEQLKQRDKKQAEELWRDVLHDAKPTIVFDEIPLEDTVQEYELTLSASDTQKLSQQLQLSGLTMNTLMQGIWASILGSMTGREDVVFGTPISGRFGHVQGIDEHIGLFSNTIPVRCSLTPNQSLLGQLESHQATQIQLLEHDQLGLGEIQHLVGGETLFDSLLVVENYPDHSDWFNKDFAGAKLTHIHNRGYTHYPLTILVLPGEQLHILFEYRDKLGMAEQVKQRFSQVLQSIIDAPDQALSELELRLPHEIALQREVNQTQVEIKEDTLHSLMQKQALRTPDQLALVDQDSRFTYRELREQVIGLANLLTQQGIVAGDIIAVALPRSVKLSLAFNSILECGAAYLPLDVSYPDERLAYMVADAQPKLIITTSEYQQRFTELGNVVILDQLPEPTPHSEVPVEAKVSSDRSAYIIYTSGSTGNPKGVLVSHRAIVNRLHWMQAEYSITTQDVVLQKTPCSFDVSVWEFFWPLIQGSTLVMAPAESHKDPEWLRQIIEDYQVTTMHFVPSMLAAFVASLEDKEPHASGVCSSLQRVFCSGEALSKELSQEYAKRIDAPLHNLYGPTEAAVDVTYCPAFGEPMAESLGNSVPIGLPVWNTQVYVLDSFLREVPIGVPGELYLAGDQLAIGYLNREALTADRFIANPFDAGERMYRTGDVVRWLSSGKIEYLGRSDDQLKIRGQRIELGEIESALQSIQGVKQGLVCAKSLGSDNKMAGADDRQLIGYAILNEGADLAGSDLKAELAGLLPSHMVPIAVIILNEFPLSANGKLDRKALPLPSEAVQQQGRKARPGLEAQLVAIFAEVLEIDTLSAEDDFFALGGHSLMAMKLAAEIRRVLNVPITVGQIMVNPTVEKLALLLLDEDALNDPTLAGFGEVLPIRAGNGAALFCINSASGFAWQYTGLPKYLEGNYPIVGLQSPRPEGAISAGKDMQDACDIHLAALREIQPHGPYHLLGYSFGGTVAQNIAAKLQQQGEEVAFLGLLDTYPPEGQDWDGPMNEEAQDEIEREKDLFLAANDVTDDELDQQRAEMFKDITANYEDAVRLLSKATSPSYQGRVDLFVAERTLPEGYVIDDHWMPFLSQLEKHLFDCSHEDIIAPENVGSIGETLNQLLKQVKTLKA